MARNTIILASSEVEPLPSALFVHPQSPKHITQNSMRAHTGPTKSTWTAVKECDHHRDSQQNSNQLKILFSTKHVLSTSVLTLTRRGMHLIHMKQFLWSAGRHPMIAIIGQNMWKLYFIIKSLLCLMAWNPTFTCTSIPLVAFCVGWRRDASYWSMLNCSQSCL